MCMCVCVFTADMGQRAHIGKVNMDYEQTETTTQQLLDETRKSV